MLLLRESLKESSGFILLSFILLMKLIFSPNNPIINNLIMKTEKKKTKTRMLLNKLLTITGFVYMGRDRSAGYWFLQKMQGQRKEGNSFPPARNMSGIFEDFCKLSDNDKGSLDSSNGSSEWFLLEKDKTVCTRVCQRGRPLLPTYLPTMCIRIITDSGHIR